MQDFKRLLVWQKAHACLLAHHRVFGSVRTRTVSGLRAQTLRAAASISANIAEGCGKATSKEFIRFLDIATGSARELENHVIVAKDLAVISRAQFDALLTRVVEVRRMLGGLVRSLREQPPKP